VFTQLLPSTSSARRANAQQRTTSSSREQFAWRSDSVRYYEREVANDVAGARRSKPTARTSAPGSHHLARALLVFADAARGHTTPGAHTREQARQLRAGARANMASLSRSGSTSRA